jgi:hypothetical protein
LELVVEAKSLGKDDMRRISFFSTMGSKTASMLMTSWPGADFHLSGPQFSDALRNHFGAPPIRVAPFTGNKLTSSLGIEVTYNRGPRKGLAKVCDEFGRRLVSSAVDGDDWRKRHDSIKSVTSSLLRDMGLNCQEEVYNLFASANSPAANGFFNGAASTAFRERQGCVPDLGVFDVSGRHLLEVKQLTLSRSAYFEPTNAASVKSRFAVETRALKVPAEYLAKAKVIDNQYNLGHRGWSDVTTEGPMTRRLREFTPNKKGNHVTPLVFGSFGEINSEFDDMLIAAAKAGAGKQMGSLNCRSESEALGISVFLLRRKLAAAIFQANANLLDNRLRFVFGNNAAAHQRRNAAAAGRAVRGQGFSDFTAEFSTFSGAAGSGAVEHWNQLV